MIYDIFQMLGFKDEEAKTYLSLLDKGACSGGELAKFMGMKRPTVYGYLDRLVAGGLTSQTNRRGVKIFVPEDPAKLQILYECRLETLQAKESALADVIQQLEKSAGASLFHPQMQFYEGQQGVQSVLSDMLLYDNIETLAMWPIEKMMDMMTDEFTHYHNKERIRRNMSIRVIWPASQVSAMDLWPYLSVGPDFLRDARLAPEGANFDMGYWIYADKVAFISSRAESFGFTIQSIDFISLLKMQFELIWSISKPFSFRAKAAGVFLQDAQT